MFMTAGVGARALRRVRRDVPRKKASSAVKEGSVREDSCVEICGSWMVVVLVVEAEGEGVNSSARTSRAAVPSGFESMLRLNE